MKRSKASPVQLIALSALGVLIVTSTLLVIPAASHYRNNCNGGFSGSSFIFHLIAGIVFFCGGGYLSIWAQRQLSYGIQSERWTEEQLRPVRKFSEGWAAKIVPFVLLGLGICFFLTETAYLHYSVSIGFWVCFMLNHGLLSLKRSLVALEASQTPSWPHSSGPLQSEHWGE